MAIVKTSSPLSEAHGKFAGVVYRRDQRGQHIQTCPSLVKREPSRSQKKYRRAYRQCLYHFFHKLNSYQRDLWADYARQHPVISRYRGSVHLTSQSVFFQVNIPRLVHDLPVLSVPPT